MSDTQSITTTDGRQFRPLKTDVLGRIQFSKQDRELILDAFEASHLSGAAFARHCGVNYQTFASWVQKRRRQRGQYPTAEALESVQSHPEPKEHQAPSLIEISLGATSDNAIEPTKLQSSGLELELPGNARLKLHGHQDLTLAVQLLNELERSRSC